jgi:hypothetical protein
METNGRQRSINALIAGISGFVLVLLVAVALNLFGLRGQGQAQEMPALFPTIYLTPTPEVPTKPTRPATLSGSLLASPTLRTDADLSSWEFVDVGVLLSDQRSVWNVEDGALLQNRTAAAGNSGTYETMAFIGSPTWSDYTLTTRFYDQGNGNVGLVVRRQGESFYRLRMLANIYSDTPRLVLEKVVAGVATPLATRDIPGHALHTWYELTLQVEGDRLQASLDGRPLIEAQDQTLTSGQPGIYTRAMGRIRFADLRVTNP